MAEQNNIKNTFLKRSWMIWGFLLVLSFAVVYRIIKFQTSERKELLELVKESQIKERIIYAKRGNIYASDGKSLLATSTSEFKMVFDPTVARQELFDENIDEFCAQLAKFFKEKSAAEFKEKIVKARKSKLQYMVISNKKLTYADRIELEKLPFFNLPTLKGGGYFEEKEIRFHPYNSLAARTIGNLDKKEERKGATGIEAQFDEYLKGFDGRGYYERLAGGYMKPLDLDSDIASEPGLDVVSTLDVNFQDIAESALRRQVYNTSAKFGSVAVMEIETGEIKAIANLTKNTRQNGEVYYSDDVNYAVTLATDPGSTFKLVSMLAILEHSKIGIKDFAVDCNGSLRHGAVNFTCTKAHGHLSVQEVFEKSCNIGIYTLMKKTFGFGKSNAFFKYLKEFRLDQPTGFQLKGEPTPLLKNAESKTFSSTTIPWMSIGYEMKLTPIQLLTFYNAVGNNGYWVQPLLVKEIKNGLESVKTFEATKSSSAIASKKTIEKAHLLMEGVVKNGTARNINYGECTVAGKTGTAQKRVQGAYSKGIYYTSFMGYFPAVNPKYSIMVVIDEPQGQNVYGGDVCAPVLKNIADKIYAYDMRMHKTNVVKSEAGKAADQVATGKIADQLAIAKGLGYENKPEGDNWVKPKAITRDSVAWVPSKAEESFQGLIGLTLRDALPILENKKYKVKYSGYGRVAEVSLIGPKTVKLVLR